jgi:hypothetical protein
MPGAGFPERLVLFIYPRDWFFVFLFFGHGQSLLNPTAASSL